MIRSGPVLRPGDAALPGWLALQHALVFSPARARAALAEHPDPRAALRAAGSEAPPPEALARAEAVLARVGAVAVPFGSAAYPERLAQLADAPPLLLVRGDVSALAGPGVAVVGARAATAYGRDVAQRFAAALAAAGQVVVSGLAVGIDGVAHAAALAAGGRTLAVLGCGPEHVYPARHRGLAARVEGAGALVSEFPPGTPPRPAHFPLRNRLIPALSGALLVVEARERSGSLVTAWHAAQQGVDVYAVPGPIDAPTSRGTNRLLCEGAAPALDPRQLLEDLGRFGTVRGAAAPPASGGRDVAPAQRRILAALRDEPLTRDALARRLAQPPERLALDLLELELAGAVYEERDGRLRLAGPGAP